MNAIKKKICFKIRFSMMLYIIRVERISLFWSGTICTQLESLRWMSSYRKIKVYTQEPIFCPATWGVPDNEPSCPEAPKVSISEILKLMKHSRVTPHLKGNFMQKTNL